MHLSSLTFLTSIVKKKKTLNSARL